jgi:GNAT superfamily N-acetyltransferase
MSAHRTVLMEPFTRVGVTVTFLRMDRAPAEPIPVLPGGYQLVRVAAPSVAFYRFLYDTVGADYVWWLRRTMPDAELAALLAHKQVSIHVLYEGGEPAGFFELDGRGWPDVNLSYFGLMPRAVGTGVGPAFLGQAVAEGWRRLPRGMTVNTCTADHRRALPTYLKAGFRPVRQVREIWNVPVRLGLKIPDALKV